MRQDIAGGATGAGADLQHAQRSRRAAPCSIAAPSASARAVVIGSGRRRFDVELARFAERTAGKQQFESILLSGEHPRQFAAATLQNAQLAVYLAERVDCGTHRLFRIRCWQGTDDLQRPPLRGGRHRRRQATSSKRVNSRACRGAIPQPRCLLPRRQKPGRPSRRSQAGAVHLQHRLPTADPAPAAVDHRPTARAGRRARRTVRAPPGQIGQGPMSEAAASTGSGACCHKT